MQSLNYSLLATKQSLMVGFLAFRRLSTARTSHVASLSQEQGSYKFGGNNIGQYQVFLTTKFSFAFVNIRPVVPGHVLVSPKRVVKRFSDLSTEETVDLWLVAKQIGPKIENHFKASSLTFVIQDGPEAGQTVPHVHIHILPRNQGDFEKNDQIYDAIEAKEKFDLDKARKNRTVDEMAKEADNLRALF